MKNLKQKPKVISIKVGRQELQIKREDYLYDNGACIMLNSGDGRNMSFYRTSTMQRSRAIQSLNYIVLTKKFIKDYLRKITIPWEEVDRTECGKVSLRYRITQEWIDNNIVYFTK